MGWDGMVGCAGQACVSGACSCHCGAQAWRSWKGALVRWVEAGVWHGWKGRNEAARQSVSAYSPI